MVGTRPEAIKMAPVISAARARAEIRTCLVSSGQHHHLLAPALAFFGLKADHDLGAMEGAEGLTPLFSRVALGLDRLLATQSFDMILVHGDTTTAAAAATAGFHRHVPIGHVEAGLRTGDLSQPFPEEFNRRLVDMVAQRLFAPTARAAEALTREGVPAERVLVTGNTVVDALHQALAIIDGSPVLAGAMQARYGALLTGPPLVLFTAHRRENFGRGLEELCQAIKRIAAGGFAQVALPVHPNPNVRAAVLPRLAGLDNVTLLEPLDYAGFVWLMRAASIVVTDSGGVQEEAPSLGAPVLVMRDKTERPEGVAAGVVELIGMRAEAIAARVEALLEDREALDRMAQIANPYGDGRAAGRIIGSLLGERTDHAA